MTEEEYRKAKELFLQLMGETTEPKKKRRRRKKKQEEQIQSSKKGQQNGRYDAKQENNEYDGRRKTGSSKTSIGSV